MGFGPTVLDLPSVSRLVAVAERWLVLMDRDKAVGAHLPAVSAMSAQVVRLAHVNYFTVVSFTPPLWLCWVSEQHNLNGSTSTIASIRTTKQLAEETP
jgi:hypothetical protein